MIKFIAIVIGLLIVGFLIAQNTWMVTVSAFGFEVRTSIIFVLMCKNIFSDHAPSRLPGGDKNQFLLCQRR